MGVKFSRLGYSSENLSQLNMAGIGDKPDPKTIQQLVAAYNQRLPEREEIRSFERKYRIMFPLDYIQFLMQINGGYPDKSFLPGLGDMTVNVFYAFDCPYPEDSLTALFEGEMTIEEMPQNQLLPIAGLSNGYRLLMRISDRRFNEIYAVPFDEHHIADSFSELISVLSIEPF